MKTAPLPLDLLNDHALFRDHPDAWKKISPHIHVKHFQKNHPVLHHGDAADSLWLVINGWVKLTRQTPDGKETIIGLCTQGDIFGEATLFPNASYPYHAETIIADTEIAAIPAEIIRGLISKDVHFSASVMSLLGERVAQTQLKLEHMSTMSTAQRLGCFLLRLCRGGNPTQIMHIPVEKHLLASYLGMKPETLSRSQQQLKDVGVAIKGTEVNVSSVTKLREFVCNSCSESGMGACDMESMD